MQYSRFSGEMSRGNKVKNRVSRVQGTRIYILCLELEQGPTRLSQGQKKPLITHNEKRKYIRIPYNVFDKIIKYT